MIKMCDTSRFHPHAHAWGISRQLLKQAKASQSQPPQLSHPPDLRATASTLLTELVTEFV